MVAFQMFCLENARLARELAFGPFQSYLHAIAEAASDWITGTASKDYRDYDKAIAAMKAVTPESQVQSGAAWIGSPDEVVACIERAVDMTGPFEHASLQINFGNLDFAAARQSVRLFASQVMPRLAGTARNIRLPDQSSA